MFLSILTCKETLARLDDYLDRALSPYEVQLVERHLKICRHCTEIFAFEAELVKEIKARVQRVETDDAQVVSLLNRIKSSISEIQDETREIKIE